MKNKFFSMLLIYTLSISFASAETIREPQAPPIHKDAVFSANSCPKPIYPLASRQALEEGAVFLKFLVDSDGKVIDSAIEKSSGFARLDLATIEALSKCQFKPATDDDKPVQSWSRIKFDWNLGGKNSNNSQIKSIPTPADKSSENITNPKSTASPNSDDPSKSNENIKLFDQALAAYDSEDYLKAIEIWKILADKGNATAQFNLGVMYERGMGTEKNPKLALDYYIISGLQGNIEAQYALGLMYKNGIGADVNTLESRKWFNRVLTNSNSTSNATDLKAKAKTQNSQLPVTPIGDEILFDGGRFVFVNINNSNCVIALQGSITRDTSRKFSNVVAIAKSRNCDKPLLLLESGGGLLDDGIMMAREVKASGYKTIVRKSCASACSMIFLGGSERTLYSKNARIGFHQPRTNLSCDEYDFDKSIKQMSRFLKYALPENYEEILGLITKTSCDSMTWVSGEEAISMGVATKIEAPNLKLEIPSGEKIQK